MKISYDTDELSDGYLGFLTEPYTIDVDTSNAAISMEKDFQLIAN